MCIDITYGDGGGGGNRIPYGFLFKNDLNEFIYSCSRCDEEFRVGNDLEQHSIGHDIKEENETATNPELSVDFEEAIEVFAEAKLPPPQSPSHSPTPSSSTTSRASRHTARRKSRQSKSLNFPANPSSSTPSLPTSFIVKTETNPADTKTNDEMSVYLPFDVQKLEVDIEKRESDAEQNESFVDDDFTAFSDAMDNNTSSDEDFFTPTTVKQANKQKEVAAAAAAAATTSKGTTALSSKKNSRVKKKKKKTPKEKVAKKNREYHCDICARIFTSLARIRQHMYAVHVKEKKPPKRPPSPTLCTLCGKHIRDMKTHLKIFHSTERPFKCDYCDATFKQKVHRDTHVRQHTGEKPYICHLCGRSYHAQSVLNAHMNRYHLHLKPHKCDQCGHAYRQLYELRDHINLHHFNQKMYQCETCNRRFGTRKHLHQHQLSHGEKRFQCKFCDQKFATTSGRRGHEIRNHGAI